MLSVTSTYMIVFRFLHIVAAAFWFGAAILFAAFVGPAAAEVGPSSGPLLANMVVKRRVAKIITGAGMMTLFGGALIYWHDYQTLGHSSLSFWVGTPMGLGLTIGAVVALAAFYFGYFGVGRNVERLVDVGGQLARSEGPPAPELLERFHHLQVEVKRHSIIDMILLLIAIATMSTARYW
jgi:uncharacterized membrane protein